MAHPSPGPSLPVRAWHLLATAVRPSAVRTPLRLHRRRRLSQTALPDADKSSSSNLALLARDLPHTRPDLTSQTKISRTV